MEEADSVPLENPRQPMPSRLDAVLRPICLALMVLALFWPAFFYDFANYDDLDTVTSNPFIKNLSAEGIGRILTFFSLQSYYPARLLSFALDYAIWGGNPAGFHVTNVLIHLLSTLLAYALFTRLLKAGGRKGAGGRRTAFFAAAFFGLHPCVVDSVAWISGREELLMLMFLLAALHVHLWALKAGGPARFLLFVLTAYLAAFSCLSNVLGVTLPPIAVALSLVVLGRRKIAALFAETWHLWVIALAAFFVKLVSLGVYDQSTQSILFPYVPTALKNYGYLIGKSYMAQAMVLDIPERIRLVISLFGVNLFHVLFPARLPVMYQNSYPGFFHTWEMLAGYLALALTATALWRTRKNPLAFFGLSWFLISLLPSAQIIPHHIWRADRFLYLPIAGFGLFASALSFDAAAFKKRVLPGAVFVAWAALLAIRAALHLPVWSDALTLHTYCVAQSPSNAMVHRYLGAELARLSQFDRAIPVLKEAVRLSPDNNDLWMVTFKTFISAKRLAEAEDFARLGAEKFPEMFARWSDLGLILSYGKKYGEAEKAFKKAISIAPGNDSLYFNLGSVLAAKGDSLAALEQFQKAVAINPRNSLALFGLGQELEAAGRPGEAAGYYRQSIRWAPGYLPPRRRLKALIEKGEVAARQGFPRKGTAS